MTRALAAAGLVALLALTGCGMLPGGSTGDNGAATSGPAPDGGGDGDQVGNPDAAIPATFPSDLPQVDGEVLEAADLGTGWVVLWGVDDAMAAFTAACDAILAAGLNEDTRTTNETDGFAQYSGDLYTVQVSATTDYPGYGPAVNYTVVKHGE